MNIIKTIAVMGLAGLAMTSCTGKKQEAAPKEELPIVEVETSSEKLVQQTSEYTATVEAFKTNNIMSATGNRIKRILVDVGSAVKAGQAVVVLDDVRSLHNVGSVFRSCDAFRVEAIYLCGITATPPQAEIHKTALGAEDSVAWRYFPTAEEAVEALRQEGYFVYSIEQVEGSTKLQTLSLDAGKKYAVVLGNEVKGVHQSVVDMSDGCLEIPQFGTKHSLNVSVTAGIVVWEFARLRMKNNQ